MAVINHPLAPRALAWATEDAGALAERRMFARWMRAEGVDSERLGGRLDPLARDLETGRTLLAIAAAAGDLEGVEALLPISDVEARDHAGATPLGLAATSSCLEAAEALLAVGADPAAADFEGLTPLMRAARGGDLCTLDLLAARGPVDAQARDGSTALMLAADRPGRAGAQACRALLPRVVPASLGLVDGQGLAALDRARRAGNAESAELIERALAHGSAPPFVDDRRARRVGPVRRLGPARGAIE